MRRHKYGGNARGMGHFLFQLIGGIRPTAVMRMNHPSIASLCLRSTGPSTRCLFTSSLSRLFLSASIPMSFLCLGSCRGPYLLRRIFQIYMHQAALGDIFIIRKVYCSGRVQTF